MVDRAMLTAGFAPIDADAAVKDRAVDNLMNWLAWSDTAAYRPQLEWLIAGKQWSILLDSFYQVMPFGTGGRRGNVGIGPNRMNLWTLGASVQGHCDYLRARFPGVDAIYVVLAYDVRQFEDKRGVYNRDLPNPVLHLTSRDFCQYAAGVYAANGIASHILPADSKRFVATPELSFTIRHLNAHGGLNMTASHNPPDDNGSKFYDERGAQPVPPEDQLMSEFVDRVTQIRSLSWADTLKSGKVQFLSDASHEAYIALCLRQSLVPKPRRDEMRVVFTPLHGVGGMCAGETLERAGFAPIAVPEQAEPNGQFPNVTKTPNPEVQECFDRALVVAQAQQADLIIATDPDADRLGGMACTSVDGKGGYRYLTGNEICALLTHFKLARLASASAMPASPIIITTEVTTSLLTRIARHFNAQIVNDLLVGFKYHADVLHQLDTHGEYGDVKGRPEDLVLASEESHGVLGHPGLRDKDSAIPTLLLAELGLHQKRLGSTIPQYLEDLSRQFGYFRNEIINIVMTGLEGKVNMTRMLDALRKSPPKSIAGLTVTSFEDLRDESGRMGPFKGDTDKAARNFLIFRMESGPITAKVCLRPSGTEPKAKAYIEVASEARLMPEVFDAVCKSVDVQVQKLATEFLTLALATVGQTPSPGADKLSR
jgi:phosphoglucomutase